MQEVLEIIQLNNILVTKKMTNSHGSLCRQDRQEFLCYSNVYVLKRADVTTRHSIHINQAFTNDI